MLSLEKTDLSPQEQYKILIGTVIPRPIAFVSTISKEGIVNLAPFSFYNIVSYQPTILSISILRKNGVMKDTARNILESGEAVVHSVSKNYLAQVNQAAKNLDFNQSELALTGMTLVDSTKVKTPGVQEALTRFEAQLFQHLPIKDSFNQTVADLMLLEVVHFHLDETVYQETHVLAEQLKPMSRLAGSDYSEIGKITSLERP
ncbi:flavin reductase family protein [Streptococcus uberis]|uniref:flavin reductase family protein n=2 Tax=Streptococcus uberis TaxID=1349 RepID=UPI001FF377AB|nr:flavin reductase family protein [Streptococcus uberis]MCK1169125.1 flavin reductase family protein [Streptococcus uberis]MCK1187936.1 flavin reductase family protein [Streptococcus uberis]